MTQFEFEAIGTHWTIDIKKDLDVSSESFLLEKIMNRIREFDIAYSRFRNDSLVTRMSKESGEFKLPSDAEKMITLYKKMYDVTDGLVTPLIGNVLVDAGYDATYSLVEKTLHRPESWDDVLIWKNPILTIKKPVLLDFGAGGKGYLVDIVSELLEQNGITEYCVDAGGDIRHRSRSALRVALEDPHDTSQALGIVNLGNMSLCGSAGSRRKWGNFHHIINPESLSSPKDISAVWVVAEETIIADLLTTGLFFKDPKELSEYFTFEYLIVYSDYSVTMSRNFPAELFTN